MAASDLGPPRPTRRASPLAQGELDRLLGEIHAYLDPEDVPAGRAVRPGSRAAAGSSAVVAPTLAAPEPVVVARRTPAVEHGDAADDRLAPDAFARAGLARVEPGVWLDPDDALFTPQPRPTGRFTGRLFSAFMTLLFLAWLGWLIVPELGTRIAHPGVIRLDDAILTAQPVPIAPIRPGLVLSVEAKPGATPLEVLPAGQVLARVLTTAVDGSSQTVDLRAPFDARFVSVDSPAGSVTQPGQPVLTVYDPRAMTVVVTVSPGDLDRLRRGMRVTLRNDQLAAPLHGTVDAAVPLVGTEHEPTTAKLVNVRVALDPDEVSGLVPGIRFRAEIDTPSVDPSQPALVHVAGAGVSTS